MLPYRRWLIDARSAFSGSPADTILTVALALSMVAALASIGYALAVPTDATESSEFYVGTTNATNQLVYDDYSGQFVQGQPVNLTVGIENQEGARTSYTVVTQFQRVGTAGENVSVLDRSEVARFRPTVSANETRDTWNRTHQVTPPFQSNGENVRLVYLLYVGNAPANPTIENADYYTYVWPGSEPGGAAVGGSTANQTAANGTATNGTAANGTGPGNAAGPGATANATPGNNAAAPGATANNTGPNGTTGPTTTNETTGASPTNATSTADTANATNTTNGTGANSTSPGSLGRF